MREDLAEDRRSRLDALGFVWDMSSVRWDVYTEQWEEAFKLLEAFKAREGHCQVPKGTIEGGINLGSWVRTQRQKRDQFTEDRRSRLDALGFVWVAR